MIWAVDLTPSPPDTNATRGTRFQTSRTASALAAFFKSTMTVCKCMIVVGTFTAIVWMFSFGRTL